MDFDAIQGIMLLCAYDIKTVFCKKTHFNKESPKMVFKFLDFLNLCTLQRK